MVATMAGKAGMAGKVGKAGNSYIFNPFALSGWNLVLFSAHSRFPIYVCFISPSPVQITLHEMIDYSQTVYSGSWGVTWGFYLHLWDEMLERWWLERLEKHSYFQENKCKMAGKPYQNRRILAGFFSV